MPAHQHLVRCRDQNCATLTTLLLVFAISLLLASGSHADTATVASAPASQVTELSYTIVKRLPHRQQAFTQGLLWHQGELWESSGQYGQSTLAVLNPMNGKLTREVALPPDIFAEGIAVHHDKLLQLSWRAQRAFCYDLDSLQKVGEFQYRGEGWGLTSDGQRFIMSDGSANLQFRNLKDFSLDNTLSISFNNKPLSALNELEWIDGLVAANVWRRNDIVFIDPAQTQQGKQALAVIARLDLSQLKRFEARGADVLNGIAWQADEQLLWVTGKYWRNLYALKITPGLHTLAATGRGQPEHASGSQIE